MYAVTFNFLFFSFPFLFSLTQMNFFVYFPSKRKRGVSFGKNCDRDPVPRELLHATCILFIIYFFLFS